MPSRALIGTLTALVITACSAAVSLHADAATPRLEPASPPLTLTVPHRVVAFYEDFGQGRPSIYVDVPAMLRTSSEPFEIRATRASYDDPIRAIWRRPGGDVALPAWAMPRWGGLAKFFALTVTDSTGTVVSQSRSDACLNTFGQRAQPDAPARSPYPLYSCPTNPFTLGTVMGIQQGWVAPVDVVPVKPLHLVPGKYTLTLAIPERYQELFGLDPAASVGTALLVVKKSGGVVPGPTPIDRATTKAADDAAPTGPQLLDVTGPEPDLRSLPAWGMQISGGGNHLQFAATVWNAGTSPLVVDGYRQGKKRVMTAYQYFFDSAENQVGYQQIGEMEWDPRPSHQHWHFEDFARYRLLNADLTLARRSKKEAFCLANTDAVDYTVPDANWNPDGTDLSTACGDLDSISVREELSSGSGDTYSQIRAGQAFSLKNLPNGTYFIQVQANPEHRLIELDDTNNDSLREVEIGGTPGARTVTYGPVGLVDDHGFGTAK